MLSVRAICLALVFALLASGATLAADAVKPEFPEPKACERLPDDPTILEPEKSDWTDCEKWAWSCIRQGLEANFFTKECLKPRTSAQSDARKRLRLAAFFRPERFAADNALSDGFLLTVLNNRAYSAHIATPGIRIFGGYFKDPVNLENATTAVNLVLDGSMMRQGLRMTNFKTEKNLSLDASNIRGSLYLMRARIDGSIFMERGVFDTVDLRDARIGSSVEGTGSVFTNDFQFDRANIDGKLILTKSRLTLLKGWDSRIGGSLEMRLADIRRKIDLTGARVDGDVRMQDVSFGRQAADGDASCDWDPAVPGSYVINELRESQSAQDFAESLQEVVGGRPSYAGKSERNPCTSAPGAKTSLVRNEALLRNMKIQGTLCIVDVTGEISGGRDAAKPKFIEAISLDGSEAKSTVLSWKPTASRTLWRAVNFRTGYMVINLHDQPSDHFIDNLDIGFITFVRPSSQSLEDTDGLSDEHLVKYKCDLTPAPETVDVADTRDTQQRVSQFFTSDKSGSAQPFANVVARLEASGVATLRLRKSLSDFKNRNACAYGEYSKVRSERPALTAAEAWKETIKKRPKDISRAAFIASEAGYVTLDAACSFGLFGLREMVYYGHEPWRLVFWVLGAIAMFWIILKLDRGTPESNLLRRRFGPSYAFDNLIPLKQYRMEPEAADVLPSRRWIRGYRAFHRGLGLLFALLLFFFVYKAST